MHGKFFDFFLFLQWLYASEVCRYGSREYAGYGYFLVKTDVFSFGVLVLEIMSGKKNKEFCNSSQCLNLLGYVSINIDIPLFQWY